MLTSCLLLALFALDATPAASQAQHQNAHLYAYWQFDGRAAGFWNVDQYLYVRQKAQASFWATHWRWVGSSSGGYLGLQTDGHRFDGSTGDTAIFSLWNATAAEGPSCDTFGGEGTGFSCRLAYPIETDRPYRLRVWRLDNDTGGQWWGAWIKDEETGREDFIGRIRVAAGHTLTAAPTNFSEYFGPAVGCDEVPVSMVDWVRPTGNNGGRSFALSGSARGTCTGGEVVTIPAFGVARITQGGPR